MSINGEVIRIVFVSLAGIMSFACGFILYITVWGYMPPNSNYRARYVLISLRRTIFAEETIIFWTSIPAILTMILTWRALDCIL